MEENSLTLAILREIRDNTAKTNNRVDALSDRVDALSDRVGALETLTNTMATVQVAQAQQLTEISETLRRLVEIAERHEARIDLLTAEVRGTNARIDNLVEGALGSTVRDHELRLRRLEARTD